jgi:hypothetical protein
VRDTAGAYYNPEVAEALGGSSDGSFTALEIESAESGSTEAAE